MGKVKISRNKSTKIPWKTVKGALGRIDRKGLLNLIEELYLLHPDNQTFLLTRYRLVDDLEPYKASIREYVHPKWNQPIRLNEARKAFARYKKAIGEPEGMLELAVYYVECGTSYTLKYGDIDEAFYNSMESMLNQAVKLLAKAGPDAKEKYRPRFKALMDKAYGEIGWGYGDYLAEVFYENFGEEG